ncbi:MAG: ArnT family glycosyltransferase, partial [Solirubrobacterales bacterium]
VAAIVALPVVYRLHSIDDPLQEAHAFRQTQTAYTALIFSQQGIDLLHPGPPVLGPPFHVPMEFPLFQTLAVAPLKLEVPPDAALRLTGLACFVATALLLYGFMRRVASVPAAIAALVLFVASPFALLWSRTSMIEYLATAGAVGFAWMTIRWREERRPSQAALALAAGSVGMLVKPTTAAFWILPALAWRTPDARGTREWLRSLRSPGLVALVAIPFVLTLLWTRHADAIKAASDATLSLTSENLRTWNFGTLDSREHWEHWSPIVSRFIKWIAGPALILLPLSVISAWRSRQRLFWLAMALTVLLPPAVFFNLHSVHDYYQVAITPGIAVVLGLGAGWAWSRLLAPRAQAATIAAAAMLLWSLVLADGYWRSQHDSSMPGLEYSRPLKRATDPDELILGIGWGWSPDLLYYARRRGLMIHSEELLSPEYLAEQRGRYNVLFDGDGAYLAQTLAQWPWVGAIEEHVYAMGDRPAQVFGSGVVATSDPTAPPAGAKQLSAKPRTIPCDASEAAAIPAGRRGTWLRVQAGPGSLIWIDPFSPVPARGLIAIVPGPRQRSAICVGGGQLEILEVLDAPPPVRCRAPRPYRWPGCARQPA